MTREASPSIRLSGGSTHPSLKVLVIDEWPPVPANSGKTIRTWGLLKRLAECHSLSLLCYGEPDTSSCAEVRAAGIKLHTVRPLRQLRGFALYADLLANTFSRYPYSVWKHNTLRFKEELKVLLESEIFDVVHCEWTPYARFLGVAAKTPTLIMAHNIETNILLRRARASRNLIERIFFETQARKMESFERRALTRADWVATVTEQDAEVARSWGVQRVSVVDNGVDLEYLAPTDEEPSENEILFLASLDWYPNVDALSYLLDEILPLIRRQRPDTILRIVGRRPSTELPDRIANHPGVELVGEVPDTRPFLARAGAVVVPLRIGGGSRIKILEALAMTKAIVSTSIGAEGLAVRDNEHLLIADSPEAFANKVSEILGSAVERRRLGVNGRRLVENRYGWDRIAEGLERCWMQTAGLGSAEEPQPSPLRSELQGKA